VEGSPSDETSTALQQPVKIPLQIRGTVIGSLDVWPDERNFSTDEINLLSTIGNRISQTLESAQLFEETQARAAREEAINRLTASIASSLDIDGVLQTTARQLGKLPTVVEASIYLGTADTNSSAPDGGTAANGSPPDLSQPSADLLPDDNNSQKPVTPKGTAEGDSA
jgi:hypothetical protein